jgi:transcriptional regulator with XRE-family HTH domain
MLPPKVFDYRNRMNSGQCDNAFGSLLRSWRKKRRLSQLDLALDAEISTKHLSFLEGGRSKPSRDMIFRLAEPLRLPLRAQNSLLTAAGFAGHYPQRQLDDPNLEPAVRAVQLVLKALDPYPSIAVDRYWNVKASNNAVRHLLGGVSPDFLAPPLNILRLSLHPLGLRNQIANLSEWRAHLMHLLRNQIDDDDDPALKDLLRELLDYDRHPSCVGRGKFTNIAPARTSTAFIPLQIRVGESLLTLVSTTMVFGTPTDVTMSELLIESLLPANEETASWFVARR